MNREDFLFPQGRVAARPRARGLARMMVVHRDTGAIIHDQISSLPDYLLEFEVWANNSKAAQHHNPELHPLYASVPGSHATPSAGIPLPSEVINRLSVKTFTLHIGSPREQPDINLGYATGKGWREWYSLPATPNGHVAAIGTTAVKALETWARTGELEGWSDLFIQPPFEFKVVQALLTNWHFSGEPLLALTCAFGGIDLVREAYEIAVAEGYMFSCYGDRLLII